MTNSFFSSKITIIPEIVHMAPRASKMTARASKMIENLITLLIKIKTLAVKQTSRSEQTEKWHGGGERAQRTGYIYIYIYIYIFSYVLKVLELRDLYCVHPLLSRPGGPIIASGVTKTKIKQ